MASRGLLLVARRRKLSTGVNEICKKTRSDGKRGFVRAFHAGGAVSSAEEPLSEPPHPTEIFYSFTPPPGLSVESKAKVDAIFNEIVWLDMIEVHLLTQLVHEKMGGSLSELNFSGPVKAAAASADIGEPEVSTEPALKDVKIVGFDANAKIKVIKEVRAIAGLGLKEAKELVESVPKVLQKGLQPEQAEELKTRLEVVGAQIEVL